VVRAQTFIIEPQENHTARPGYNSFSGRVRELSYMGGEVRYFVELDSGAELHVIGMVRAQPYRRDTRVVMQVEPQHCRLLAKEPRDAEKQTP
jgi:hypothetical protein